MKISTYLPLYLLVLLNIYDSQVLMHNLQIPESPKKPAAMTSFLTDFTYRESVKTVQFHKDSWPLSYPVLELDEGIPLILSFDDLGNQPQRYTYTLTHCDYQWEETRILRSDYIDGMEEEIIEDYTYSINTHQNYIHYRLEIPNAQMKIRLPGNYVITVYDDFNHDKPVLSRRFFVVEPRVTLEGRATRSNNLSNFSTHHEVDFKVLHPLLRVDNPDFNIRVVVMQNLDWTSAKSDLRPTFAGSGELIYDYEEENQFPALSEYRHFETKNLNYITEGIDEISFVRPLNQVYLTPAKPRSSGDYYFEQDINGKFVVTYHLNFDPATGADYTMTHFKLPFEAPITGGNVFVFGALSDWGYSDRFKMDYNFETHQYELGALLKQGYYNYTYRFVMDNGQCDPTFLEGSFFETENDYLVMVYYQDYSQRYQELVGYLELNNIPKEN